MHQSADMTIYSCIGRRICQVALILALCSPTILVAQSASVSDKTVNYCQLMEVGQNYGRLSLQYSGELPVNEVNYFNEEFDRVFTGQSVTDINTQEFVSEHLFQFGKSGSFPSTAHFHADHTTPYVVFHITKEVYRAQNSKNCIDCIQNSMDTINILLSGTPLWKDFNDALRVNDISVPLERAELLTFDNFLKCYYFDNRIYPKRPINGKGGPKLRGVTDTTIVACFDDIDIVDPTIINNCSIPAKRTYEGLALQSGINNCNNAIYVATYSLRSPCGQDKYERFFKIKNDGPTIACPPDIKVTCVYEISAEAPSITTSCGLNYTLVTEGPTLITGQDFCQDAEYIIKYIVTDECGRTAECTQRFTIDMDSPLTITCGPDEEVECKADIVKGSPSVKSFCDLDYDESSTTPKLISGKDDCPGAIYEVLFTAVDICGNKASCKRRYTIQNDPPKVACSQDEIVECKDDIVPNPPLVEQSCTPDVTIDIGPITLESGQENCEGAVYKIEYKIIDGCGRKDECIQRFTISNDPPMMICPDDVTVECINDFEADEVDVETSCDLESDDTNTNPKLVSGTADCPNALYEVEYHATDDCGRSIACVQQIRIENDPPTIECPPDQQVYDISDIEAGEPIVSVSCTLDKEVTVTTEPELVSGDPDCPGAVYKLTYTVVDACDRETSCDQLWTILGEEIIIDCPPDISVKCRDDILPHISNRGESWLYSNAVKWVTSDPRPLDDDEDCPGAVFEVEHTYTIHCDSNLVCIQRFTIENEGPKILCPPSQVVQTLSEPYNQDAEIEVDCVLPYELDISDPELIDGDYNRPGSYYYVTYTVTDDCDREASCQQKLSIIGLPKEPGKPCDCDDRWQIVSKDLVENREHKFNQDIAKILAKKSCEERKKMVLGGISEIYNTWASSAILNSDFALTNGIRSRGPLDFTLKNLSAIDGEIKYLEALLFAEAKEIKKLFVPRFLNEFAKIIGINSTLGGNVVSSIKSLGDFIKYLNSEIIISNLKTFANEAKYDANYFHVDHYLERYVNIEQYKTVQLQSWEDFKRIHAIYEYSQIRLMNPIRFNATELWESQANLNTFRSATRSMLNEVCGLYCKKVTMKENLDQLKLEQSMLRRFQHVYDYFMSTDCQGELKPDCDALGADLVQNSDGTYKCECPTGTKLNPDEDQCVPYEDCTTRKNTFEDYQNGVYTCACDRPGYLWDPSGNICAELPICDEDNMTARWDDDKEAYVCDCEQGYKLDPDKTFCAEVEDCAGKSNSISEWDADKKAYVCNCVPGYKPDPSDKFCAPAEDCTSKQNTELVWVGMSEEYVCQCLSGYDLDPSRKKCVPKPECSITNAELKYNTQMEAYECNCVQGYVKDANDLCVPEIPDCSPIPNSEPVWNQQYETYECKCKLGYAPDPNGQNCVLKPVCNINDAVLEFNPTANQYECNCIAGYIRDASGNCEPEIPDCSHMGNAEAVWNSSYEVYECKCEQGYVLDGNVCVPEIPNCNAVLSNSEAVWNNNIEDYECHCISGYDYDASTGNCELIKPDCGLYYFNTKAVWSSTKGDYVCDCIGGYVWNSSNTGCVDPLLIAQASCTGAFTRVKYDKKKNEYKCDCQKGYKWNKSRTGCEPKVTFGEILTGLGEVAIAINEGMNGQQPGGFGTPQGGSNNPQVKPENAHPGNCNTRYKSGANEPESYSFNLGFTASSIPFSYETFTAKDRIHIYSNGQKIYDSGCVGTKGTKSTTLRTFGGSIKVVVDPLCDPSDTDTEWNFTLGCPN